MTNQVATRGRGQQAVATPQQQGLPAWLVQGQQELAKMGVTGPVGALAPDMGGSSIPRLSIDGGVFTVILGKDNAVQVGDGLGMEFVIVQAAGKFNPHRRLFDKEYDPNDPEPGNLVCWSTNVLGTPDDNVVMKQSPTCQNCPSFKACGASWPALIWVVDPNYTGPARWNMNFNTRRNPPVLPQTSAQYRTGNWYNVDQFLELMSKSGMGTASFLLRAEQDRGKEVVKGKCIIQVLGTVDAQTIDDINNIDPMLFDAVFSPVIQARADVEGTAVHDEPSPSQMQARQQATAPRQQASAPQAGPRQTAPRQGQRQLPSARVQENVEDAQVEQQAHAPRQMAPRQPVAQQRAPRGVPPGTEDDIPQQPTQRVQTATRVGNRVTVAPQQAAPAQGGQRPVFNRGAAGQTARPAGVLGNRTRPQVQQAPAYADAMDEPGSDDGYAQ